jgi:hypothetical protein
VAWIIGPQAALGPPSEGEVLRAWRHAMISAKDAAADLRE